MSDVAEHDECEWDKPEEVLSDAQVQRSKRLWNEIVEDDGGSEFVEVTRKHKKLQRSFSRNGEQSNNKVVNEFVSNNQRNDGESKTCGIVITTVVPLPKQMALAKLLRSYDITNIIKIQYKNTYKVVIVFESEECASVLLNCEEFTNLGFKCQRSDQMALCYGIVRRIDLDMDAKELQTVFESEYEIESVMRLKRQNSEGKWVESETVRLCFKGSTMPPYVVAYGCRFLVEPYTFPVTQCAGCWRYGHTVRFCPQKKELCPKCGSEHANCETKEYKCINCKGPHMSLEKTKCPVFKKEKDIRSIMSKENYNYKKAFELYHTNEKVEKMDCQIYTEPIVGEERRSMSLTDGVELDPYLGDSRYRNALLTDIRPQKEDFDTGEESSANESIIIGEKISKSKNKKKQRRKKNKYVEGTKFEADTEVRAEAYSIREEDGMRKEKKLRKEKFNFVRLFNRLKEAVLSEKMLDEKITIFLTIIVEECYIYIADIFNFGDCINKFLSIFNNG